MSLAEIENELSKLSAAELRQVALSSWSAFLAKEGQSTGDSMDLCEENDPELLHALDDAVARADRSEGSGFTADDVRNQIRTWTTG